MKELTKLFKALANERRLRILSLLAKRGKGTVSSISRSLGLSIRSISKHLLKLEDAGLVGRKQTSKWVYYSLNDNPKEDVKYLLKILRRSRRR
ncbi:MAG TPA: ArsR family transcriptional regulator [bacterium]|nr:ArsR family transcriptional regulator [bacterium]